MTFSRVGLGSSNGPSLSPTPLRRPVHAVLPSRLRLLKAKRRAGTKSRLAVWALRPVQRPLCSGLSFLAIQRFGLRSLTG